MRRGFTLIEVLMVLAVIAILATLAMPPRCRTASCATRSSRP